MAKTAAIIPARWASTRFPGKPLHAIAGKPLIQHVWQRCLRARALERVIIATDDARIADAARVGTAASRVPWYRHQGIYGYSARLLLAFVKWKPTPLEQTEQLEQLRALEHGVKIRVVITKHASIGVDTPDDVALAEQRLSTI